jgi:uncharacterized membrane protein YebE (DUF533 family)
MVRLMNRTLTSIKVWAAAAWADGMVLEEEALAMELIIAAAPISDDERELARRWIKTPVTLEDLDLSTIPREERLVLYTEACKLVGVDHYIASAERGFLFRLGNALALDEAEARRARHDAERG